ncbi:MAG: hypothetical protein Q8K66_04150 [Sediminibacterium sp.]|nr:hypothetical protein [Sediminibacterium sp.]MDP3128131.1 hypothetical protein [Sediminibacterium sp.]
MPHIVVDGCNTEMVIQEIQIHANVTFKQDFYIGNPVRAKQKLNDLQSELEEVIKRYFNGDYEADNWLNNHDYNGNMDHL